MGIPVKHLETICFREELPDKKRFDALVEAARTAMEATDPLVRPRDRKGFAGGFVRLSGPVPTIIVPDLHARREFLLNVVRYRYSGETTVLEGLATGAVRVVCVGDAFHSEQRCRFRWLAAYEEYRAGILDGPSLTAEVADSMGLMEMIMECIFAFPENFFFLKGNHENILNTDKNGNHPFRKYAEEGEMFYRFFLSRFGKAFTTRYARFENTFPLCVVGDRYMVSHAEPGRFYDEPSIINARLDPRLIRDFTWTGNGDSEEGTVEQMLAVFLPDVPDALYFGGHRPVAHSYALRASGRYVQIHDPYSGQVVFVPPDRPFDFTIDMRSVEP